jgi:two-component system copper resistance phosphate regulon response regulator CusR
MHVLLVEDNKRMAQYLKRALVEEGYAVDVSHDGDEGLSLATRGKFDVVVLDLMLPGRSGMDILREFQKDRRFPTLMISARTETEDRVRGLDGGADDYLTKPFAIEEFKARVRAVLRRAPCSRPPCSPATT